MAESSTDTERIQQVEQKLAAENPVVRSPLSTATTPGTTVQSLAQQAFYREGQTPARFSGNNQASSLAKVADANVNFNPLSAGIRAVGDIGSSIVNGAFGLAANSQNISWQRQQWDREWQAAQNMGLYSPTQIANAASGTPSSSDIYTLNSRGLRRQPRTMPGSPFGT